MMMGTVPTSIPQFILLGNWLLEMDFKRKWYQVKTNKLFWVLTSIFFVHVCGLFYTENLQAGWNDVRTKLPLLFLPVVFFTNKPLSLKELHLLLYCFLVGCLTNTGWCLMYNFVFHKNEVGRNASRFMSHIRLGLYLNMGIACCLYFIKDSASFFKRLVCVLGGLYFLVTMYALGLISGLVNFFILCFLALVVIIYRQRPIVKLLATVGFVAGLYFIFNYVNEIKQTRLVVNDVPNNQLLMQSPSGRYYAHFDTSGPLENGNYILRNIQTEELKKEWGNQCPADTFSYPPHPHNMSRYEVLIRYLASKGLNKDSVGVSKLTEEDKKNIQNNVANYQYPQWSFLHKRVYELVCEYDDYVNNRNVNGQSLTMRLYFWKAATCLVSEHPFAGVGTGDVQDQLNDTYVKTKSPLHAEWYKRPHNQFLTIAVALGVCGLVVFLMHLIYPLILLRNSVHILFWPFFILAIISFFLEDTLETQAGLSFYAVFNSLFLSTAWFKTQTPSG